MSKLILLRQQKEKFRLRSRVLLLGLPIFLSLSRLIKEWAPHAVLGFRGLTPIYVGALLYSYYRYKFFLHESIILQFTSQMPANGFDDDEGNVIAELKKRKARIVQNSWYQRHRAIFGAILASVLVFMLLWSLSRAIEKPPILSYFFAVFALVSIGIYYFRTEFFTEMEKSILAKLS